MGEAKRRKMAEALKPKREDPVLTAQMTLPQRVLDNAGRGLEGIWPLVEKIRANPSLIENSTGPWNSWCYIPVNAVRGIIAHLLRGSMTPSEVENTIMPRIRLLSTLSGWRMTKGVYVFDPVVANSIIQSDIEDEFPDELFFHLPDWCPYVSTPGLEIRPGLFIHGFFASVDDQAYASKRFYPAELSFEILVDPKLSADEALAPVALSDHALVRKILDKGIKDNLVAEISSLAREKEYVHCHMNVELGQGKFSKAFKDQSIVLATEKPTYIMQNLAPDAAQNPLFGELAQDLGRMQTKLGGLLLYLVSDRADITPEVDSPQIRERIVSNERRGIRNFPAAQIKPWDVGFRIGAEIRAYAESTSDSYPATGTNSPMRPHVRRAHWHSFWTGPRDKPQERKKKVRWLPPTAVNVTSSEDLVPTMHKVIN